MANLNVTYDDLNQTATQLTAGQQQLQDELTRLSGLIHNLTSNGFQAEHSSAAYRDAFDQFTKGTSQAIDGLSGLSQFLTSAATALQQTDEGLANSIQG